MKRNFLINLIFSLLYCIAPLRSFAIGEVCKLNRAQEYSASSKKVQDYGVRGHIFVIQEQSLLEVIQNKLKKAQERGEIKYLQQQFKKRVVAKIKRPIAVRGVVHTTQARSFYYDPTYTQQEDIKDHIGNIIVARGTTINPLKHLPWGEPLIFIDGDDKEHVAWALQKQGKIILVKGAALDLHEEHKLWFYFDQAGVLTEKFGITQVPAIVSQEGLQLKITEYKI